MSKEKKPSQREQKKNHSNTPWLFISAAALAMLLILISNIINTSDEKEASIDSKNLKKNLDSTEKKDFTLEKLSPKDITIEPSYFSSDNDDADLRNIYVKFLQDAWEILKKSITPAARNICIASKRKTKIAITKNNNHEEKNSYVGLFDSINNRISISELAIAPDLILKKNDQIITTLTHELHHLVYQEYNGELGISLPFKNDDELLTLQNAINDGIHRIITAYNILRKKQNHGLKSLTIDEKKTLQKSLKAVKNYPPQIREISLSAEDKKSFVDIKEGQADKLKTSIERKDSAVVLGEKRTFSLFAHCYIKQNNNLVVFGNSCKSNTSEDKLIALYADTISSLTNLEAQYREVDLLLLTEVDAKTEENGQEVNHCFYPEREKYHKERLEPIYQRFGC